MLHVRFSWRASMTQLKVLPFHDQGRVTNIQDVPTLAPYFFVDPNYLTPEAQFMRKSMPGDDYRK